MEWFYRVTYVILDLFSLYCIRLFLHSFLAIQKQRKSKIIFCYSVTLLFFIMPNLLFANPILNIFCSWVACMSMASLYSGSVKYKIVLSSFAVILGVMTEASGTLVVSNTEGVDGKMFVLFLNTIAKLSYLVVIRAVNLMAQRKRGKFYASYYWWLVLAVPVYSVYMTHMNYEILIGRNSQESIPQMLVYIYMLLAINILVFYLYDKLLELHEESLSMEQIRIQNQCYTEYFETERQNHEKLRQWKHDIKNYLLGIIAFLDEEKYGEARQKLADKADDIMSVDAVCYSGNAAVDSILNYKLQAAQKRQIKTEYTFRLPNQMKAEPDDLAVLLGNSIDNAIEAVSALEEEKRVIRLSMNYDRGILIYKISNEYQKVNKSGGRFLSTKGDRKEHGIGMRSMQRIAEKYGGSLKADTCGHIFTLEIVLFL